MANDFSSRRYGITGNPYYESKPFTDFSSVTPETPIEELNLNWREKDLPERERTKHVHRLHPYLGKFIPQLAEIFLRKYRPRVVCDPFCGSGTTLVEANCLGIESVGCDICEFNCLLTEVKLGSYDLDVLKEEINQVLEKLHLTWQSPLFRSNSSNNCDKVTPYLRAWFAPQVLQQLLCFRELISDCCYKPVFQVILSRAARSARLTTHYQLDFPKRPQREAYFCYKHNRICFPPRDALRFLQRYCLDTYERLCEYSRLRTSARATVICGDARHIRFPTVDMVLTSPPYVGLIDYHEQHRYAYEILGLPMRAESEIGSARMGQSQAAIRKYLEEMTAAFDNVLKSLRRGGHVVVIVNDRHNLYDQIGQSLGVKMKYRLRRHVNRRTGRRASDFFEEIIVWQL